LVTWCATARDESASNSSPDVRPLPRVPIEGQIFCKTVRRDAVVDYAVVLAVEEAEQEVTVRWLRRRSKGLRRWADVLGRVAGKRVQGPGVPLG
jgi:hypothetical protein